MGCPFELMLNEETVVKRTFSIPEWHELAQNNSAPPMRIPIHGDSMYPLVRKDRDLVTIMAPAKKPEPGDIVLFADPNQKNRYVLHRIWKIEGDRFLTWGDNCDHPDGWIGVESIWGKAELIERGKRTILPNPGRGLRLAAVWHRVGKGYRFCRRIASALKRRMKQVLRTPHENGKQDVSDPGEI